MNLSKITPSVASFLTIMSLSTCAVAGTADIVKKQLIQQLKFFQLSQSQLQPGNTLQKTASGSTEITVADSIQTFSWENSSWEKDGCTRYSYDSKGRIKEENIADGDGGVDSKNTFEYDPDGKTIKHTAIWNWGTGGELFNSETTYSVFKYYPGYTNAIIQSNMTQYTALIDLENFIEYYDLDSLVTISYDAAMDTTYKTSTKYVKINEKIVRANITFTSMADEDETLSYRADYIYSGNGNIDTMKCIFHFDAGTGSMFEELLSEMQYLMIISKSNQGNVIEQTVFTAKDSTFTSSTGDSKMKFYTNTQNGIDSMINQEWDTLTQVWENTEKVVYTLKKITVGVKKSTNTIQAAQQVTLERKNGTMYLNIPSGMAVSVLEVLDLQGKVISRTAVTNAKNSIVLNPNSKNSSTVSLVRLKTDRGHFACKVSTLK